LIPGHKELVLYWGISAQPRVGPVRGARVRSAGAGQEVLVVVSRRRGRVMEFKFSSTGLDKG